MERPKNGKGTCVFGLYYNDNNKNRREELADSIRVHLQALQPPDGIRWRTGSTVIACPVTEVDDSAEANSNKNAPQVQRVLEFVRFLDAGVRDWISKKDRRGAKSREA